MFSRRGNNPGSGASQEGAGPDTSLGSSYDILYGRAASEGQVLWCSLCKAALRRAGRAGSDRGGQAQPAHRGLWGLEVASLCGDTGRQATGHSGHGEVAQSPSQHTQKNTSDHTLPTLPPSLSIVPHWTVAQAGSSCFAQLQAEMSLPTGPSPSV